MQVQIEEEKELIKSDFFWKKLRKNWRQKVEKIFKKKLEQNWGKLKKKLRKIKKKVKKSLKKKNDFKKSWRKSWKNIARGTTDPGYWVYNLNQVFD